VKDQDKTPRIISVILIRNNTKKNNVPASTPSVKKRLPNDICFDVDGNVFEVEGELVKEVVGNAKRAMPNHNNFEGKYNPSYVLFRA
jgi:hypothetical protein